MKFWVGIWLAGWLGVVGIALNSIDATLSGWIIILSLIGIVYAIILWATYLVIENSIKKNKTEKL